MKILVSISSVPDTTSRINFKEDATQLDMNGVSFIINPNDEYGLTKAILLKESQGASVTVVSVGDTSVEATLRKAIALGADRAIRIDALASDGFVVASELASLVKEEAFDLVITGKESLDFNGGMVGAMLATLTEYSFVDGCVGLDVQGTTVSLQRESEEGLEKLSTELPVVISAQKGLVQDKDLRIPNMRGIMAARTKTIEQRTSVRVNPLQEVLRYEKPQKQTSVKMISPDNMEELITFLKSQKSK